MEISIQVKELISYHSGVKIEKLHEGTLIEEDLGTTGDDAWELMEDIHSKLNVDLTDFDFTLHFAPEAGSIDNKEYGYYPVSVGHLIQVASNKKWMMPEKDEENFGQAQKLVRKRRKIMVLVLILLIVFFVMFTYAKLN